MEERIFNIDNNIELRVDKYLAGENNDLSRSYIQKLIDKGKVYVNGKQVESSYNLRLNDRVRLVIPPPKEPDLEAVSMDLNIIFEDDSLIVINKPPGLVVHPVPGNRKNTLVNGLLAYTDDLSGIGGVKRPGIVHRLDKNTSGVIVVAKTDHSHRKLVNEFKERKTDKAYRALVRGEVPYKNGKIDAPIGRDPDNRTKMAVVKENSKKAVSFFEVIKFYNNYTYLQVSPKTGRTHQIRVHMSYMGYPVVGDKKYGKQNNELGVRRQMLHAHKIGFHHPDSGEWVEFIAPLTPDFKKIITKLEKDNI